MTAALEKLKNDPEREAQFMRTRSGIAPAYNVQTAVDAEHGLIVAQQVTTQATDNRSLLPMAEAAKAALDNPEKLNVVADAGYSNGKQAERCEQQGIQPHAPANRTINNQGEGTLFDPKLFIYDEASDTFRCPADKLLTRKQVLKHKRTVQYAASAAGCCQCPLKAQCTAAERCFLKRHLHDGALQRMNARATSQAMRLRRCTVERPFATVKYVIFGHPRFLLRLAGAQVEISLATMTYNLKTIINLFGGAKLSATLAC